MLIAALAAVMTIALSSLNSQLLLFTTSLLYLFALGQIQTNFCELCCLASDDGAVRGICLCVGFVHSFHG